MNKNLQSQTINWLRFPLIVLVVFIHNQGMGTPPDKAIIPWGAMQGIDYYNFLRLFITNVFARIAVPTFFIISGYYFFIKNDSFNYKIYNSKIHKRIRTLLIPYILWNLLAIIPTYEIACYLFKNQPWPAIDFNLIHIFWNNSCSTWKDIFGFEHSLCYPFNVPLWYIRDLIIMILISPIVYSSIKRIPKTYFTLLAICGTLGIWPNIVGFYYNSVLFFSIGSALGIYKIDLIKVCSKYAKTNFIITIITMLIVSYAVSVQTDTFGLNYIFYISCIMSIFNIVSYLIKENKLKVNTFLLRSTFFVYAYHYLSSSILLSAVVPQIYKLPIHGIMYPIIYMIIPILKICICLGIFYILEKTAPKLTNLLTGSRL